MLVAKLDESADRRGRRVEDGHFVIVDDLPESVRRGEGRRAFVHQSRDPVLQGAVDHIGMTSNPSDVGRAPIDIIFFEIKNQLAGVVGAYAISAGCVDKSLWLPRRAGGIEDVERMLGIEWL